MLKNSLSNNTSIFMQVIVKIWKVGIFQPLKGNKSSCKKLLKGFSWPGVSYITLKFSSWLLSSVWGPHHAAVHRRVSGPWVIQRVEPHETTALCPDVSLHEACRAGGACRSTFSVKLPQQLCFLSEKENRNLNDWRPQNRLTFANKPFVNTLNPAKMSLF